MAMACSVFVTTVGGTSGHQDWPRPSTPRDARMGCRDDACVASVHDRIQWSRHEHALVERCMHTTTERVMRPQTQSFTSSLAMEQHLCGRTHLLRFSLLAFSEHKFDLTSRHASATQARTALAPGSHCDVELHMHDAIPTPSVALVIDTMCIVDVGIVDARLHTHRRRTRYVFVQF